MATPNRDYLHWAHILETVPPGRYALPDFSERTGLSYGLLQQLFKRARHPRVTPDIEDSEGRRKWFVIVHPDPVKRFERYRQQRNLCHSVRVYPAKRLQ